MNGFSVQMGHAQEVDSQLAQLREEIEEIRRVMKDLHDSRPVNTAASSSSFGDGPNSVMKGPRPRKRGQSSTQCNTFLHF
jgi:hypothetical protein